MPISPNPVRDSNEVSRTLRHELYQTLKYSYIQDMPEPGTLAIMTSLAASVGIPEPSSQSSAEGTINLDSNTTCSSPLSELVFSV